MPVNKLSELKRGASAAPEDVVIDIEGNLIKSSHLLPTIR